MEVLSVKEIDKIHDLLLDRGVEYEPLRLELLDHICCAIEEKMDCGWAYGSALEQSINDFGPQGLARTNEATIYLLTMKVRKMKKTASIVGFFGGILTVAGTAFKLLHWPLAEVLLMVGMMSILCIYLPAMMYVQLKQAENNWGKAAVVSGMVSAIILGVATLFKIMHWPGASVMVFAGALMLCLVFMPLYFVRSYKTAENKMFRSSLILVIFAGLFLFIGLAQLGASKIYTDGVFAMQNRSYVMEQQATSNTTTLVTNIKERHKTSDEQITALHQAADDLYNFLDQIRLELIAQTNGVSLEHASKMPYEKVNWLVNTNEIRNLLFNDQSEISLAILRQKMEDYRSLALRQYRDEDSQLVSDALHINTNEMMADTKTVSSWENANFSNKPLFYVVSYLDMLKTETRHIESQVLMYLLGQNTTTS